MFYSKEGGKVRFSNCLEYLRLAPSHRCGAFLQSWHHRLIQARYSEVVEVNEVAPKLGGCGVRSWRRRRLEDVETSLGGGDVSQAPGQCLDLGEIETVHEGRRSQGQLLDLGR